MAVVVYRGKGKVRLRSQFDDPDSSEQVLFPAKSGYGLERVSKVAFPGLEKSLR